MLENKCTLDEKANMLVVDGICQHGRLQQAPELIDDMYSNFFLPNAITYTTFIQTFCKEGNMVDDHKLLTQMKLFVAKANIVILHFPHQWLLSNGELRASRQNAR